MTKTKDSLVARVRAAMALASDQTGTPEGDTAARIARRLMDTHNISDADLDAADDGDMGSSPIPVMRRRWQYLLAAAVVGFCQCAPSLHVPPRGPATITAWGTKPNREVAQYLAETLIAQLERSWARDRGFTPHRKVDYMCSAVAELVERLADIQALAAAENDETALVIYNKTSAATSHRDSAIGGEKQFYRASGTYSQDELGTEAGASANINTAISG